MLVALSIPFLLLLASFAINVVYMQMVRSQLQMSCDSAAKAALIGLTRSLARTLGRSGVTVNAISPGAIQTQGEVELAARHPRPPSLAPVSERQAVPRQLVPDDLVATAQWLASPGAAAVTGQVIEVGGGLVYR